MGTQVPRGLHKQHTQSKFDACIAFYQFELKLWYMFVCVCVFYLCGKEVNLNAKAFSTTHAVREHAHNAQHTHTMVKRREVITLRQATTHPGL